MIRCRYNLTFDDFLYSSSHSCSTYQFKNEHIEIDEKKKKEKEFEIWKLQFKKLYGSTLFSSEDKVLFLLSLMEGEPYNLCTRFAMYNIDEVTSITLWEVLDRRYGGESREDHQVMEEFDNVKVLETYDLKDIHNLADCLISVQDYYQKVEPRYVIVN